MSGSWCASGISSSVRLAAWIAARRATVMTSPLGASPAATRAAASGDIRTTARARAQRDGLVLGRDVDHAGVARRVEVGERTVHPLHGTAPRIRAVRITVRLFAGLRERAGSDHVELDLPDDAAGA